MSFEKPPLKGPAMVEQARELLKIPERFSLNPDEEMQAGLRDALVVCDELLNAENLMPRAYRILNCGIAKVSCSTC